MFDIKIYKYKRKYVYVLYWENKDYASKWDENFNTIYHKDLKHV